MAIRDSVKGLAMNLFEKVVLFSKRRDESIKFKDDRRKSIYSSVTLTPKQKAEIDALYVQNYGKKIPYIWHQYFTAFTGKFTPGYFPELLYIPEFERYMNYNHQYATVFSDKNILPLVAQSAGVTTPKVKLYCTYGILRDSNGSVLTLAEAVHLIEDAGELFMKPTVDSCSGQGCRLIDMHHGTDRSTQEAAQDILTNAGQNFVIQHRLKCHPSIAAIYPNSVNTFRVITYRWKDEFRSIPAIMRIGQGGGHVDNAHAGGMFIAVDADGTLKKTAFTEFRNTYTEHPDSHVVFEGYKICNFDKVIAAALRMHRALPQLGSYNWDFTIDETGDPVLIEANIIGGSIWLVEMAHGVAPFGEHTAEILQWLRKMEGLSYREQAEHLFGN